VVLFSESTIVAELAYLSWPKYSPRVMGLILCGITATGIGCIALRALARRSDVGESCYCFTSSLQLIECKTLALVALWAPPALSSIAEGCLLIVQSRAVWKNERMVTKNVYAVAAVASRQL